MKLKTVFLTGLLILCTLFSLAQQRSSPASDQFSLVVLGTAQDGGYPQANCSKKCCAKLKEGETGSYVTSIAICDFKNNNYWLIDCTPDVKYQLTQLRKMFPGAEPQLKGIFLTHAHIGHYLGLAQLGREVMGTEAIPVYAMTRFCSFLKSNGPWSQLVSLRNIRLQELQADSAVALSSTLKVRPVPVPHRDEFSETVGYRIEGSKRKVLFIPDIDKWELWDRSIETEISRVDLAFLDGTFNDELELPGRNMDEIPHPLVSESCKRFNRLNEMERSKIHFIHFNHTNPLLWDPNSQAQVTKQGYKLASQLQKIDL